MPELLPRFHRRQLELEDAERIGKILRETGEVPARTVEGATAAGDPRKDGEAARELARRAVELYLPVVRGLDVTLELAPEEPAPLERFVIAGTPDEVVRKLEELAEAGVGRVELGPPLGRTAETGLRLLAERVLPHFRA